MQKNGDEDDEFFILADGEEIEFIEEKNDNTRTLSFSLPQGTEEFEIIGTILLGTSFLQDLAEKAAQAQAEAEAKAEAEYQEYAEAFHAAIKAQAEKDAAKQAEEAEI